MDNQKQFNSFAEQSLALVRDRSVAIQKVLKSFSDITLGDYLSQALSVSKDPLQPRSDLVEIVYCYAKPLIGKSVAEKAAVELEAFPAVLTANHHGVDFLAQSIQGSLIFSLRKINNKSAETIPVFACGSIALNNPTYPRGILLYQPETKSNKFSIPVRLPIFPDRYKRKTVSSVESYNSKMIIGIEKRISSMVQQNKISKGLSGVIQAILDEDYQNSSVMKLTTYSQQAVLLNNRIWKRCFQNTEYATEMVYLELEKITSLLLQHDLNNEDNLIWQILFNPKLRTRILKRLDGVKACWNQSKLVSRFDPIDGISETNADCGTMFFWGLDNGCRVPLLLVDVGHEITLQGRNDRGDLITLPFKPQDILDNLQAGRLLPSLFTCYSTIGFARGVSCCGGYFQAHYLLGIQRGLVSALCELDGYTRIVEQLSLVPSDIYLSGMQTVTRSVDDNALLPVGPIELIANGGLSQRQLEHILSLTLYDIHLAGLIESLPDFQSTEERTENWCLLLANELNLLLKNRVVII